MKKILVINKRLDDFKNSECNNKRIILKKNITIIKDLRFLENNNFIEDITKDVSYKWYIEEWEVMNDNRIQMVCANDGSKLRAVHVVTSLTPRDGVKALFQSEKMLILKMANGVYEFSKNVINTNGEIREDVLNVGTYKQSWFNECKDIDGNTNGKIKISKPFENIKGKLRKFNDGCGQMIDSLIKNHDLYRKSGYLAPLYATI
jgi:hypothetical protein